MLALIVTAALLSTENWHVYLIKPYNDNFYMMLVQSLPDAQVADFICHYYTPIIVIDGSFKGINGGTHRPTSPVLRHRNHKNFHLENIGTKPVALFRLQSKYGDHDEVNCY